MQEQHNEQRRVQLGAGTAMTATSGSNGQLAWPGYQLGLTHCNMPTEQCGALL